MQSPQEQLDLLQSQLRSFSYPSDEQVAEIKTVVAQDTEKLQHLQPEILHVVDQNNSEPFSHSSDSQLHTLLCQQESVQGSLTSHLSLLSPIRKLPIELLAEIFILSLPEQLYITPSPSTAPLLLASVCAGWRTIALSTPKLWSSLHLRAGIEHNRANSLLPTWLSRTSSHVLSLSLPADLWRRKEISDLLNRSSLRWKHVRLNDELPKHQHAIWNSTLNVPMLETFELHAPSGESQEQLDHFSSVLSSSNCLTRLVWVNGHMSSTPLNVAWSNVTHLTLNVELPPSFSLELFQNARNLVQLIYHNIRIPSSSQYILPTPVCLPYLESLAMAVSDDPCVLFDSISLPALKHLELTAPFTSSPSWTHLPTALCSLLERSRCPLETLDVHFLCFNESQFIDLLLPIHTTLREATLEMEDKPEFCCFGDKILRLLSNSKNRIDEAGLPKIEPCLCPCLQSIAVYNCVSCTEGAFASMIQTRLAEPTVGRDDPSYVARLYFVEIFDNYHEHSHLEKLRKQGLILQAYSSVTKEALKMDIEDEVRLRRLFEDGILPIPQEHTISAN